MFLVDKPYLSGFFKKTVRDNDIPVVGTDIAKKLGLDDGTNLISEERAIALIRERGDLPVYTTSENAIGWLAKHLAFSSLPEKIDLFKNKLKFRQLTKPIFPDFYFREVLVEDFKQIPKLSVKMVPLVIGQHGKPEVPVSQMAILQTLRYVTI